MSESVRSIQRSDLRDGWTLARTELVTQYRHLRGNTRQTLGLVAMALAFAVFVPMTFIGAAMGFGHALVTGSVPLGSGGVVFAATLAISAYLGAAGGFNQPRVGRVGPLIQTSIPPLAVSLGRFWNRALQTLWLFVAATIVLLCGVGVGAASPLPPIVVAVAIVPVFAAGFVVGRILGDLGRYANERVHVSRWLKALVGLVVMGTIFVGTQVLFSSQYEHSNGFSAPMAGAILPGKPLQAYASVAFAPFGSTPQPLGIAVVGAVLVVIPVGFLAAMRLETRMLVSDLGSDAATTDTVESHGVPRIFEATPSTRAGWRYLLRTRRDPRTLAHLAPLLFGAFGMGASVVRDPGIVLTIGPAAAVIGGAVLAGAAYCLNPLGDELDQLPLLLTSTPSLGSVLRGRMIAGISLGLVVGLGIGLPLGVVEHGPGYLLGQAALALFLTPVSTGIAIGLGAVAPKFEQREYMNVERAHPSQLAMMGFLFGGAIVGAIGFVLLWATLTGRSPLPVAFGWLVYLTVLGLASWGGYRYAVRRMDGFTMDDL